MERVIYAIELCDLRITGRHNDIDCGPISFVIVYPIVKRIEAEILDNNRTVTIRGIGTFKYTSVHGIRKLRSCMVPTPICSIPTICIASRVIKKMWT